MLLFFSGVFIGIFIGIWSLAINETHMIKMKKHTDEEMQFIKTLLTHRDGGDLTLHQGKEPWQLKSNLRQDMIYPVMKES